MDVFGFLFQFEIDALYYWHIKWNFFCRNFVTYLLEFLFNEIDLIALFVHHGKFIRNFNKHLHLSQVALSLFELGVRTVINLLNRNDINDAKTYPRTISAFLRQNIHPVLKKCEQIRDIVRTNKWIESNKNYECKEYWKHRTQKWHRKKNRKWKKCEMKTKRFRSGENSSRRGIDSVHNVVGT